MDGTPPDFMSSNLRLNVTIQTSMINHFYVCNLCQMNKEATTGEPCVLDLLIVYEHGSQWVSGIRTIFLLYLNPMTLNKTHNPQAARLVTLY